MKYLRSSFSCTRVLISDVDLHDGFLIGCLVTNMYLVGRLKGPGRSLMLGLPGCLKKCRFCQVMALSSATPHSSLWGLFLVHLRWYGVMRWVVQDKLTDFLKYPRRKLSLLFPKEYQVQVQVQVV